MTARREDYFAPGDWNAICDGCGAKLKASTLRKDWQGWMKCGRCWEPRHPQDFVRDGNKETPVPWKRPPGTTAFSAFCTPNGQSSIAGASVVGCWIAGYLSPSFDPNFS